MVKLASIKQANAALKTSLPSPTAVVAGGTAGIGLAFLTELAAQTASPTIYIIGRSSSNLASIIASLTTLNPSGTYIPIVTPDLTLVSNFRDAAKQILAHGPKKVDILFLSPGYLSFTPRQESPEGLDKLSTLRYYGRMRLVLDLLPLLDAAPNPRVLNVLAGGKEGKVHADDLGLRDPAHNGFIIAAVSTPTYTTIFFEKLAKLHPKISFVHSYPGAVKTGLLNRKEVGWPVLSFLLYWVIVPLFGWLILIPAKESGERHLWAATAGLFASREVAAAKKGEGEVAVGSDGAKGSGTYTINEKGESVVNDKVLKEIRDTGVNEKIWEHTFEEYKRILGEDSEVV
ncbi:hypothetical protein B0T19DRAFT_403008 [Cercophora scortea]|uniref:NAD(P)-binding protein n=1 Tax=Cercophora scortea TaxID=314031 RepID=A0AAE0MAR8_9PEZI|nr:hypothetical protein B0T19DRAFT_403008 [Cercophora scortea]